MVVNTIHWFRKGLRLHDNPSLLDSVRGADTLRFVYILDPWFAGSFTYWTPGLQDRPTWESTDGGEFPLGQTEDRGDQTSAHDKPSTYVYTSK